MLKRQGTKALVIVIAVALAAAIQPAMATVGPENMMFCKDLAFSIEEDFVTQGPVPPDGNPIVSDGDLLGPDCVICARNADLLSPFFNVEQDLGLDAVHVIDADPKIYQVAFSTELDSPHRGQFTAGDLLVTNVGIIPNVALLAAFNGVRGDLGLDAVQFVGSPLGIHRFLDYVRTVNRQYWVDNPGMLAAILAQYEIDILFSTEGTGPLTPTAPGMLFLDGDFLSARFGVIVYSNAVLLPGSVPAGIPVRGVDFGLDAGNMVPPSGPEVVNFSTSILFEGTPSFTDGDLMLMGNGVVLPNKDLIACFEPKTDFLGLDAFFSTVGYRESEALLENIEAIAAAKKNPASMGSAAPADAAAKDLDPARLEACRTLAFSTEEEFVTRGPEPPDGNPIISDGDLLGKDCVVCARNADLLYKFDVSIDLGLDAVDMVSVEAAYVAFSTELDSPHNGPLTVHFTAGDLLVTNGAIIPNLALMRQFNVSHDLSSHDLGLDALFFVGHPERIVAFIEKAALRTRNDWLADPDALANELAEHGVDIWFSIEGTAPKPDSPTLLDGDLLSAATGVIMQSNDQMLPPDVPAGIPARGVDFGLDAVTGSRDGSLEMINFSTEILYRGEASFTDGNLLKRGGGMLFSNEELVGCFAPTARFLGLDAIHRGCIPHLEWTWNSTAVEPSYDQVMMAPVVADLNGDGVPDIIFSTFDTTAGWLAGGILRAISGDGSGELFSVTDPAYRVQAGAEPAVADVDHDGRPEIMVSKQTGEIICFEHNGAFKWATTGYYTPGRIGIAVADLDHDGTPDIISGNTVLNSDGTLRWSGTSGSSYVTLVADLDLDGSPEVVTGGTAYRYDGTVYWSSAPAGRPAIGNFDADPFPEIVVVGSDQVTLKEHDGTVKWGPVSMPTGGGNGPPVVADMDGDGELEIGVGGFDWYVAFETDGTIKWMASITDHSSRAASSSAFDFDGDGSFEIVYSDEWFHRIFKGSNGGVLFEAPGRSGTLIEQPIIADVDNDGHVEIVFAVNNYGSPTDNTGIEVYGVDHCWPDARKIWNQHTYHITNINDDATVPAFETDNWLLYNNYRTQAPAVPVIEGITYDPCISECPTCPDANISVAAYDPAGGALIYTYDLPDGGTIIGAGANVAFDPPDTGPHPCPYRVVVTVTSTLTGLSSARTIGITVKLTGDVNADGVVNILDKVAVRNAFGSSGPPGWIPADVNCDGVVNILDKVIVRNQFGQSGCACD